LAKPLATAPLSRAASTSPSCSGRQPGRAAPSADLGQGGGATLVPGGIPTRCRLPRHLEGLGDLSLARTPGRTSHQPVGGVRPSPPCPTSMVFAPAPRETEKVGKSQGHSVITTARCHVFPRDSLVPERHLRRGRHGDRTSRFARDRDCRPAPRLGRRTRKPECRRRISSAEAWDRAQIGPSGTAALVATARPCQTVSAGVLRDCFTSTRSRRRHQNAAGTQGPARARHHDRNGLTGPLERAGKRPSARLSRVSRDRRMVRGPPHCLRRSLPLTSAVDLVHAGPRHRPAASRSGPVQT
jgi:hypothetical protein